MEKAEHDAVNGNIFEDISVLKPRFLKPREMIGDVFARQLVEKGRYASFLQRLEDFLRELNNAEGQAEAAYQMFVQNFLQDIGYAGRHCVSTIGRTDLAICHEISSHSPVASIIEVKRPDNAAEMCTEEKINVKALQEALSYAFREILIKKNYKLTTLIVTDGWEWFIFNVRSLWQALTQGGASRRKYVKACMQFFDGKLVENKTAFLYKEVMAPAIDDLIRIQQLECCHFSLRKYFNSKSGAFSEKKSLREVYKLLCPETLVGKVVHNDANMLNKGFYDELLYIMGLEEVSEKVDGQKKIVIRRAREESRQYFSLLESSLRQASYLYPGTPEEEFLEPCLEIVQQWVNRVIFLKLLETQLLNYHDGDENYRFLSSEKIRDFGALSELFFGVLAVRKQDRDAFIQLKYQNIPYLNSSLFEMTPTERAYVRTAEIMVGPMTPYAKTVLVDSRGKPRKEQVSNLEYLLTFLDSYAFGVVSADSEAEKDGGKQLISAAVLGLIFEKINGYKDGSVFTPNVITGYMSERIIRDVILKKLNKKFDGNCADWSELYNWLTASFRDRTLTRRQVSDAIDSVHICDPAVGSGHFLVSALNQLINIKSDLGVLLDDDDRLLPVEIKCINDELAVWDENDEFFRYNPKSRNSRDIQRALFEQKRRIIESCLFGVDINPKSVQICCLRLWTELLKNAYYQENGELQTLPNIDINIRIGNSLISNTPVCVGRSFADSQAGAELKEMIGRYKKVVIYYRSRSGKEEKLAWRREIQSLRNSFANMSYGQASIA